MRSPDERECVRYHVDRILRDIDVDSGSCGDRRWWVRYDRGSEMEMYRPVRRQTGRRAATRYIASTLRSGHRPDSLGPVTRGTDTCPQSTRAGATVEHVYLGQRVHGKLAGEFLVAGVVRLDQLLGLPGVVFSGEPVDPKNSMYALFRRYMAGSSATFCTTPGSASHSRLVGAPPFEHPARSAMSATRLGSGTPVAPSYTRSFVERASSDVSQESGRSKPGGPILAPSLESVTRATRPYWV